jgi:hypothetical protein
MAIPPLLSGVPKASRRVPDKMPRAREPWHDTCRRALNWVVRHYLLDIIKILNVALDLLAQGDLFKWANEAERKEKKT